MSYTIIQFAVQTTPSLVMVRIYVENATEPMQLYYQSPNSTAQITEVTFPRDGLYTFYLNKIEPDTDYKYHMKVYKVHGEFRTLPEVTKAKEVKFNMLSCFGYANDTETSNSPRHGVFPDDEVDFNLLLGDSIYADYYYPTTDSKILNIKPALSVVEFDEVYQKRLFNVHKIKKMFKESLNFILADDHEIFNNWNAFYRSFQYDTTPGTNGFSELQIAANIIYSVYSFGDPTIVAPPPPIPVTSQDDESTLWSVQSPNYITGVMNGYHEFQDNLNPNLAYFKFSYGKHIDFFVLNIMADRTPMSVNNNSQILSIISLDQMNWLLNGLAQSRATVKFIVTTEAFSDLIIFPRSPLSPTAQKFTFTQLYTTLVTNPSFYAPFVSLQGAVPTAVPDYEALTLDQQYRVFGATMAELNGAGWMYYDQSNQVINIPQTNKQRTQIINFIKDNEISGVIFLTGDSHTSYVGYVDDLNNPNAFPLIEICSSPSGSEPTKTITDYIKDDPLQKQFAYATHHKSYMHITTDLDDHKIHIKCIKHNCHDFISINLNKYKKLQDGHSHKKPIKVNHHKVL